MLIVIAQVIPQVGNISAEKWGALGLSFAAALLAILLLTPVAMKAAHRAGVIDRPDQRRVHTNPIPRWGGVAMYLAFACAVLLLSLFLPELLNKRVAGILIGGVLITALGAIDDKYGLPAVVKLLGQIAAAFVLAWPFGVRMIVIGDYPITTDWLGILLAVIWVVCVINAVNLIDGLDGLAAGICSISALTFLVISVAIKGAFGEAILAAALIGTCVGFLRFNFFPARIFMGDSGSHFLGFTIAALSMLQHWKVATVIDFAVPLCILSLPLGDMFFAVIRRGMQRQPIFRADKGHLHHRLLERKIHHRDVVLIIYSLTSIGSIIALFIAHVRMWQ